MHTIFHCTTKVYNDKMYCVLHLDPDDSILEDGAEYSTFVVATTNDGNNVVSPWSDPVLTLPAGAEPG